MDLDQPATAVRDNIRDVPGGPRTPEDPRNFRNLLRKLQRLKINRLFAVSPIKQSGLAPAGEGNHASHSFIGPQKLLLSVIQPPF